MTRRRVLMVATEVAFFLPFWLLPIIAQLAKHQDIVPAELLYSVYLTVLLSTVTAYFHRTLPLSRSLLLALLAVGAIASIWTKQVWNSELSARAMLAAIDTNNAEAKEFLFRRTSLSSISILLALCIVVIPLVALVIQIRQRLFWSPRRRTVLLCVAIAPIAMGLKLIHDPSRPKLADWKWLGIYAAASDYPPADFYLALGQALRMRRDLVKIGSQTGPVEGAKANDSVKYPKTYVVVIGESLSKYHMQLYGYHRETTPRLTALAKSGELVVFRDVVAAEDSTLAALSAALVIATGKEHKPRTVIDLFNSAGFHTYWISNQHNHGSFFDTGISRLVQSAVTQIWLNPEMRLTHHNLKQKYDGDLIASMKSILKEPNDKVIFLHLIGSHIEYEYRYPSPYKQLSNLNNLSCLNDKEIATIQHYDNSVRYNDEVVSSVIEEIGKVGGDAFVFYMSDHGEEAYDFREYFGHGGVSISPYIAEVPFMLWLSPEYRIRRPELASSLLKEVPDRHYSARDLSSTLADLAGVTFPYMDSSRSVVSPEFVFRDRMIVGENYDRLKAAWKPDADHGGGFALAGCQTSSVAK